MVHLIQLRGGYPPSGKGSPTAIGIDRGVAVFAQCSDGKSIPGVSPLKRNLKRLAWLQKDLSRKKKFSSNWKKTQEKIQKLHHHIAKENRKSRDLFHFIHCGHTEDAHVNASVNILVRGLKNCSRGTRGDSLWSGNNGFHGEAGMPNTKASNGISG